MERVWTEEQKKAFHKRGMTVELDIEAYNETEANGSSIAWRKIEAIKDERLLAAELSDAYEL